MGDAAGPGEDAFGETPGDDGDGKPKGGSSSGGSKKKKKSGGGLTAAQKKAKKRAGLLARRAFISQLKAWGIPMTKNLKKLGNKIVKNAKKHGTFDPELEMRFLLRKTKAYKDRFKGIGALSGDNVEDQYLALEADFKAVALKYGASFAPEQVAQFIKLGVDANQLDFRLSVTQKVKDNATFFEQFNAQLVASGQQPLDLQGQLDFVQGKSTAEFYQVWEKASLATLAKTAGLELGSDVTDAQITGLAQGIEDDPTQGFNEGEVAKSFQSLAQKIKSLLPLSRIAQFDLTKSDLFELEFGGPNATDIAARVEKIIATVEAGQESTATPTLVEGSEGPRLLGAARGKAQTE